MKLDLSIEEITQLFRIMLQSNKITEQIYSDSMGKLSEDFHQQRVFLQGQIQGLTFKLRELFEASKEVLDNHATPHKQRSGARRTTDILGNIVYKVKELLEEKQKAKECPK